MYLSKRLRFFPVSLRLSGTAVCALEKRSEMVPENPLAERRFACLEGFRSLCQLDYSGFEVLHFWIQLLFHFVFAF